MKSLVPTAANQLWVADITYIPLATGEKALEMSEKGTLEGLSTIQTAACNTVATPT